MGAVYALFARGRRFRGFSTTPEYDCALIETHLYKEIGSQVDPLKSTSDSIGVSLLHFQAKPMPGL